MKNVKELAEKNGLQVVCTTSDMNGYPRNERKAIVGFSTFEEADKFADENQGEVCLLREKNGWSHWYDNGENLYEVPEIESNDHGFENAYTRNQEKDVMADMEYYISAVESEEEKTLVSNNYNAVLEEVKNLEDDNTAVFANMDSYEVVNLHPAHWTEGNYRFEVAVRFFEEENGVALAYGKEVATGIKVYPSNMVIETENGSINLGRDGMDEFTAEEEREELAEFYHFDRPSVDRIIEEMEMNQWFANVEEE